LVNNSETRWTLLTAHYNQRRAPPTLFSSNRCNYWRYGETVKFVDAMQLQGKALADPSRFQLLRYIAESDQPVGIKELTALLGFNHNAIRQHLAILIDADLIVESTEIRTSKGRPRKLYQLRSDALDPFSSIAGSFEHLADLLLEVIRSNQSPYDVGFQATTTGAKSEVPPSEALHSLVQALAIGGFEPDEQTPGVITLQRCPFASIAAKDQSIVCELHRGLIDGQLSSTEHLGCELSPKDPDQAGCLVSITSKDSPS